MARILSIALNPTIDVSCDADRVQPMHKTRTTNVRHHPGGGGINVARVLSELGQEPGLLYLSGGSTGKLLQGFLEEMPLELHRFAIAEDIRLAYTVHEEQSGFEYRFVPEGPEVGEAELAPVFAFLEGCSADYIVASGSLPRGVPADTYARVAGLAQKTGARFVFDASGPALHPVLETRSVFLFKPSIGELEAYARRPLDEEGARQVAEDLVSSGAARYVALTFGTKGAMLAGPDGILRIPSIHVSAKSAVGAGDSFVAAMTFAMSRGVAAEEAFRFANCVGAAGAMTYGTDLCRVSDVLTLYNADCRARQSKMVPELGNIGRSVR
ncbi:1-phosphofructokinase family hexose kinase [Roseibium sp. RKSG952]|uniref:1-phosphofructokinase family hexose kinase n=1 Tax=Roseibium sp. RKSG952 TaxID=2529384 RepID=UPI0012BC37A8|nr:1-phosphofructokinase family hexose kinase [Roseibium sp. RKSG952]MTH94762.1 1-phosphofructokinase family hexose kinase [Roseibium sp. RKSG952]